MAIIAFAGPDGISETTRITANIASAGTTLSVRNTEGFSADDFIILGAVGNEQTELVQITTVDSDTQLTISATNFAHNIDDIVSFSPYDEIQFSSASSITGAKTIQGANLDIEWDENSATTEVNLVSVTSGYAFARFVNSETGQQSAWSSAVPVAGFEEDSLRKIIDLARLRTQEATENLISDNDLLDLAKECSDIIETIRKNWGYVQKSTEFDLTAGVQAYARPTDLAGPDSIERLFLGIDNRNLDYLDNKDFWYKMQSIPKTKLTANVAASGTTLNVTDTRAFGTTGSLVINGITAIGYTGKTIRSFTGVTGVSSAITANAEVFRSGDLDQPNEYSFWNNHILFFPPVDRFYNANIDYYSTIPRMTNFSAQTAVPFPHLFTWYLMGEIYNMRGKTTRSDKYLNRFEKGLQLLSLKNRNKQKIKMQPALSYIRRHLRQHSEVLAERIRGDNS